MIAYDIAEFEAQNLSAIETDSAAQLLKYLILKLPETIDYEDLYNLHLSLFCSLDILPENLRSLQITKDVLAVTFMKIADTKDISEYKTEADWLAQIDNFLTSETQYPDYHKAKQLISAKDS